MAENWWALLLSGAIGSIVGGLMTLGGVWLVIWHERSMRRNEALDTAVANVGASANALSWPLPSAAKGALRF